MTTCPVRWMLALAGFDPHYLTDELLALALRMLDHEWRVQA